jgi:hypothetical protein
MSIEQLKLASYVDEAGEDPVSACKTLSAHKFNYIVLRNIWSSNICDATDQSCSHIRKLFVDHNLSVVALVSDIGKVDSNQLQHIPKEKIDRLFHLASYFQTSMVRIHCGVKSKNQDDGAVLAWAQMITERCLAWNLTPIYEIIDESIYYNPVDVAKFLSVNKRWRLLYDPVQLIIRQNQNPFTRYWTLLKPSTAAVDLRDFKIGYGYKPVGVGDARIKLTVDEGLNGNYKGWYFFEPSLGRRYASAVTKAETFKLAYEALENLVV